MKAENPWAELSQVPCWTPIDQIGRELRHVRENLFCAAPNCYIYAVNYDQDLVASPQKRITLLLWAESEGAALRAALLDIEADQPVANVKIPAEMLLAGGPATYGSIVDALNSDKAARFTVSDRFQTATDGAFIHRAICGRGFEFYFRNRIEDRNETPYAIRNGLESAGLTAGEQ